MKLGLVTTSALLAITACVGDEPVANGAATDAGQDVATKDDAGPVDIDGATTDAAVEATPPACDPTKAFQAPLLVPGLTTTGQIECSRLSQDELTIYITSDRADAGTGYDLYVASRATRSNPFGPATPLANVNSDTGELSPTVTADGLTLAFARSEVAGGALYQLFLARRAAAGQDFGAPAKISGVNAASDSYPFFLADGSELWFQSNRVGGNGQDIYRAPRLSQSYANPVAQTELNTAFADGTPVLSEDGLTIFWSSTRPDGNARGAYDIWTARRSAKNQPFAAITNVAELNTAEIEVPTWLSTDGCRLYFEGYRGAGRDLYVAERGK